MSIENERELEERNRELLERLELTHIIESHQQYELLMSKSRKLPIIIKFGAKWCGPCNRIESSWNELICEYADYVDFYSCDVDNNEQTAIWCGAMERIPYFFGLNVDGKVWFTSSILRDEKREIYYDTGKIDYVQTIRNILIKLRE